MLPELLQGTDAGGFLIIQDTVRYSGRHLLKSFITSALSREESVHVLGFDVSEEELRDGLKGSPTQRLHFHNAFTDPLGWTDRPAFTVHQFNFEELTHVVKQTSQPKPATLIIDSLSWILRHVSPSAVCKTLQQLKKGVAVRAIIGLLHADMHQRGTVGSLRHLASSVITVAPGMKGDEAVAKITKRSKSGKVMQDEEIFNIKEDFTVIVQSKPSHIGPKQPDSEEQEMDPTANLTFNLRLSDTEREAKEKLALPFVFSKEKKTALLHSGPGSGRILYEPDANDDYDQEDPDDDLDV
ncbi:elongator complex protein 5 [Trachinotus anak]|uniref:elongator complex protein 5 n=1 Tax=Trachinotus anak TaxID=443729 RepID=UPI0039F260BA